MSSSSSSPQGNSPNNLLGRSEHYAAGRARSGVHRQNLSLNVECEEGSASDSESTTSKHSPKLDSRKRMLLSPEGDPKTKRTTLFPAATDTSHGSTQASSAATPIPLDIVNPARPDSVTMGAASSGQATPTVLVTQTRHSFAPLGPLRMNIFPKNVARPTLTTDLPAPGSRFEKTTQLAYCYSLFARAEALTSSAAMDGDGDQFIPLDTEQQNWIQEMDIAEQDQLRMLIDQLINKFSDDNIKGPADVAEIILVAPVLDREAYRALLSCFVDKFERAIPLDPTLLQGLVQVVENAPTGYLIDNDLDRIVTVLSKELSVTYTGASNRPLYLIWALSRIVDVMSSNKVKDLSRDRDHQPIQQQLDELKESSNIYLHYQAEYVYQALQYVPDDETPLQALWRYTQVAAPIASGVASIFELDPTGFLEG
ncbi:hypothetical protein BGZ97_005902, partial [Linnemannia gamsii]